MAGAASPPPLRPTGQSGRQPAQPERNVAQGVPQGVLDPGARHFGGGGPPAPRAGERRGEGAPVQADLRRREAADHQERQSKKAHQSPGWKAAVTNSQLRKQNSSGFWQRLKAKKGNGKGGKGR